MDIEIFKLATKIIISFLIFRQAATEDEYERKYKYHPDRLLLQFCTLYDLWHRPRARLFKSNCRCFKPENIGL
jgi:hypothetical protein